MNKDGRRSFSIILFLLGLAFVPALAWLGFWQLDRADYKRSLEDRYFDNIAAIPLSETTLLSSTDQALEQWAFREVKLIGSLSAKLHFLLDNQVYEGRAGYRLISVFSTDSGMNYLVDRGWLAGPASRDDLPEVPGSGEYITLVASLWPDMGTLPKLDSAEYDTDWPRRIQRVHLREMNAILVKEGVERIFPRLLRMGRGQEGALTVIQTPLEFNPERHTGYAVQWFGLMAALVIGMLTVYRKQKE